MGDLGVIRPEDTEVVVVEVDDDDDEEERENGSEVVRWERLLTRTVLRVLLVEADDSTRHIIAALLRKCNYKVAAISDGFKAWEVLKRRHNNIDLVLTELDLPSISGYALLTLIMEHDDCKNIPVIIMSSQDSISMVLKCMLKGATDFLVKPVRRNELKNLWRHVWRRLAMNVHSPQNLTTGQCKVEATFENHPATNHSSDNVSSSGKNSKVIERATDAQELSQMNHREEAGLSHKEKKHHANHIKLEEELAPDTSDLGQKATRLASEGVTEDGSCTGMATEDGIVDQDNHTHRANNDIDGHELAEPSSEAEDLIGRINKQRCTIYKSGFNGGLYSLSSSPELELSLRRSDSETKEVDERHILNHSSASAFSWYSGNKKSDTFFPSSVGDLPEIKGGADTSAWPKAFSRNGENKLNILVAQSTHGGVMFDGGAWTRYGSMFQPMLNPVKGPRARSPTSAFQREESPFLTSPSLHSEPGTHSCTQGSGTLGETGNHSSGQAFHEPKNRESVELDPSGGSSTPCNGFSKHKSSVHGGVSEVINANPTAPDIGGTTAIEESVRDNGGNNTFDHDQFRSRTGHHSAEREAALAKFRVKRKGRCYEKKVRYQSRKRLAELRPRVKGQFVRQAPSDQVLVDGDKP